MRGRFSLRKLRSCSVSLFKNRPRFAQMRYNIHVERKKPLVCGEREETVMSKEKEIRVTFYANVESDLFDSVKRAFEKYGPDIIGAEFPELSAIGSFGVEAVADVNERI